MRIHSTGKEGGLYRFSKLSGRKLWLFSAVFNLFRVFICGLNCEDFGITYSLGK